MNTQLYLTVLIPAYNEQEGICKTITSLTAQLERIALPYEILIVDDGSQDQTVEIVQRQMLSNPHVRLVQHGRNMGIGAGIKTGIAEARGEFMIFIPADLAMKPEQIIRYIEASSHAEIVLGNRSDRRDYTLIRKIVSWSNIFLLRTLFGLQQHQFAYINLYRTSVLKKIRIETHGVFISHEMIIKARDLGSKITEIEVDYVPRDTGKAQGARLSTVLQALRETWRFWFTWVYRTLTHKRNRGYYDA